MIIEYYFVCSNGPELSCGDVQPVPCRVSAHQAGVGVSLEIFLRAAKADGWFRQLERLVRRKR